MKAGPRDLPTAQKVTRVIFLGVQSVTIHCGVLLFRDKVLCDGRDYSDREILHFGLLGTALFGEYLYKFMMINGFHLIGAKRACRSMSPFAWDSSLLFAQAGIWQY